MLLLVAEDAQFVCVFLVSVGLSCQPREHPGTTLGERYKLIVISKPQRHLTSVRTHLLLTTKAPSPNQYLATMKDVTTPSPTPH